MAEPTDWSDPCAALGVLRPAYYALLAGSATQTVSFADRSVSYRTTDIAKLELEVRRLEGACAEKNGLPSTSRRRAITAGTRYP